MEEEQLLKEESGQLAWLGLAEVQGPSSCSELWRNMLLHRQKQPGCTPLRSPRPCLACCVPTLRWSRLRASSIRCWYSFSSLSSGKVMAYTRCGEGGEGVAMGPDEHMQAVGCEPAE